MSARQFDRRIIDPSTINQHGTPEHLHEVGAGRLGERRADGASIRARRFAELDLDELVRRQRDIERTDEPFRQPILAHLHDRIEVMPQTTEKTSLFTLQHPLGIPQWRRLR